MLLKVLHVSLMLLRSVERRKGAEVTSLARGRILLTGIEAILSGFELTDHIESGCGGTNSPLPSTASTSLTYRETDAGELVFG
jgi:hypothetical protein